jgi:sulfotransferase family protein
MQPPATKHNGRSRELTDRTRFFVAGVPKAGTTALCEFLGQHPDIFMCPIKEPSFFAASELLALEGGPDHAIRRKRTAVEQWFAGAVPEYPEDGYALTWSSYQALFRDVRDEVALGEGSTIYWSTRGTPRAIQERFPAARFVLVLRSPADRFFSQYLAARWSEPLRSCRDFFALAHEDPHGWAIALDFGRYATHLRRFFECFPRQQFSIHLYEDFCADPGAVCREIFTFLGVADHSIDVARRVNEPRLPRWAALHAVYRRIAKSYRFSIPAQWREPLRRIYQKPRSREVLAPADRRMLVDYYREEILETSELIERDLSSWLR